MKENDKTGGSLNAAGNNAEPEKFDPEQLIVLFRKFEKKQAATRILAVGINLILFVIYTALAAGQTGKTATGYVLCGAGFIIGAAYLYFRYRPLPAGAYTLPITDFLRRIEKRLRYFTKVDYIVVIPILIVIGIGGGLIFTGRLIQYTDRGSLLTVIWIIFFACLCLFGFLAGKKNWSKDNSAFNLAVRDTLDSLDSEIDG